LCNNDDEGTNTPQSEKGENYLADDEYDDEKKRK